MPVRRRRKRRKRRRYGRPFQTGMFRRPSLNYHKYRLTQAVEIKTDAAGSGATAGRVMYWVKNHDLDRAIIQAADTANFKGLSDITSLKNLFDMYRVQYIKISYTPRYDKGASVDENGVLTGLPVMYVSNDPDNNNVQETPEQIVQKLGAKRFDMSRPWTYRWKPKRISGLSTAGTQTYGKGWINLQGTLPPQGETIFSTQGTVKVSPPGGAPVALENTVIGNMLLEYYVEFKSRK